MALTYDPIATTTLGSNQATVVFSSISGTYTDLVLVANIKHSFGTTTDVIFEGLQFNSDTGSNYSSTYMFGNGTSAVSTRNTSRAGISIQGTQSSENYFSTNIIQIQNYSNTTTNKTVLVRASAGSSSNTGAFAGVGLWRSTSAITSITINATSTFTIQSGSSFTLYGIKAA